MRRVRNVHNQKSYFHCSLPTENSRRVQIIEQFPTFREWKVVIWFFTLPREGVKLKYQETYYELFDWNSSSVTNLPSFFIVNLSFSTSYRVRTIIFRYKYAIQQCLIAKKRLPKFGNDDGYWSKMNDLLYVIHFDMFYLFYLKGFKQLIKK